ncbi:hypothetical protein CFIMG_007982RA00001 [Ceratocystis fimbriata CBS 114723]|uniref:Uncharacterized protein n=1 Tax=Ceratocystis fimbriata CBS 114723 TaxID=1035309 RepID=A0A2C5XAZ9_9PEZI|nr:hypothetical protein CFIMG_007982RA00001 [Ceratocystis fimbriata CBS 114723]
MCIYEAHQCSRCPSTQPVLVSPCRFGIVRGPRSCHEQQTQGMQCPRGFLCSTCRQPPRPNGFEQITKIVTEIRRHQLRPECRPRHSRFVTRDKQLTRFDNNHEKGLPTPSLQGLCATSATSDASVFDMDIANKTASPPQWLTNYLHSLETAKITWSEKRTMSLSSIISTDNSPVEPDFKVDLQPIPASKPESLMEPRAHTTATKPSIKATGAKNRVTSPRIKGKFFLILEFIRVG